MFLASETELESHSFNARILCSLFEYQYEMLLILIASCNIDGYATTYFYSLLFKHNLIITEVHVYIIIRFVLRNLCIISRLCDTVFCALALQAYLSYILSFSLFARSIFPNVLIVISIWRRHR